MATVHLIEVSAWDPVAAAVKVFRFTDLAHREATTLDDRSWLPWAAVGPVTRSVMDVSESLGPRAGNVTISNVVLRMSSDDGTALSNSVLMGRPIEIRRGQWGDDYSAFNVIYSGEVLSSPFTIDEEGLMTMTLALSSLGGFLDVPLLSEVYEGTGGIEGPVGLAGTLKPLVFGKAKNIELVQLNAGQLIYQVHGYGPITAVDELFQRGVSMGPATADYANLSDLTSAVVAAGSFATCLALGLVRLGADVQEPLTADVTGDAGAGQTAAGMITRAASIAGIDANQLDAASFTAFDTAEPAAISYVRTDQIAFSEFASDVLRSFFGYWTVNAAGLMQLGRIRAAGAVLTPPGERVRLERVETTVRPLYERKQGYEPVWRVQRSGEYNEPVPGIGEALEKVNRPDPRFIIQNSYINDGLDYWETTSGWSEDTVFHNGKIRDALYHAPVGDDYEFLVGKVNPIAMAVGGRAQNAEFSVVPGGKIYVECYGTASPGTDGSGYLVISYYRADGTFITEHKHKNPIEPDENFGQDDELKGTGRTFTVPANAFLARFSVVVRGHTTGGWWFTGFAGDRTGRADQVSALETPFGPTEPSATNGATIGTNFKDEDGLILVNDEVLTANGQIEFYIGWDFGPDTKGWAGLDVSMSANDTGLVVTTLTTNSRLFSPENLTIDGSKYDKVVVRLKRLTQGPGSLWEGPVLYYASTAHPIDADNYRKFANQRFVKNTYTAFVFDMANLSRGGDDWKNSIVTQLRLDLGETSDDEYEIDWIGVGRVHPNMAVPHSANLVSDLGFKSFDDNDTDTDEAFTQKTIIAMNLGIGQQISASLQVLALGSRRGRLRLDCVDSGYSFYTPWSSITGEYQTLVVEGFTVPAGTTGIRGWLERENGVSGAVGARNYSINRGPIAVPYSPVRDDVEEAATKGAPAGTLVGTTDAAQVESGAATANALVSDNSTQVHPSSVAFVDLSYLGAGPLATLSSVGRGELTDGAAGWRIGGRMIFDESISNTQSWGLGITFDHAAAQGQPVTVVFNPIIESTVSNNELMTVIVERIEKNPPYAAEQIGFYQIAISTDPQRYPLNFVWEPPLADAQDTGQLRMTFSIADDSGGLDFEADTYMIFEGYR